jgi:hypothetical protein
MNLCEFVKNLIKTTIFCYHFCLIPLTEGPFNNMEQNFMQELASVLKKWWDAGFEGERFRNNYDGFAGWHWFVNQPSIDDDLHAQRLNQPAQRHAQEDHDHELN